MSIKKIKEWIGKPAQFTVKKRNSKGFIMAVQRNQDDAIFNIHEPIDTVHDGIFCVMKFHENMNEIDWKFYPKYYIKTPTGTSSINNIILTVDHKVLTIERFIP